MFTESRVDGFDTYVIKLVYGFRETTDLQWPPYWHYAKYVSMTFLKAVAIVGKCLYLLWTVTFNGR